MREKIIALWDEYSLAQTPETRAAKALDKLETLMRHAQGANPPDFDYAFNFSYGKRYTDATPLLQSVRERIDVQTRRRAAGSGESR
jgi:putative hydrolase of HD superfamily